MVVVLLAFFSRSKSWLCARNVVLVVSGDFGLCRFTVGYSGEFLERLLDVCKREGEMVVHEVRNDLSFYGAEKDLNTQKPLLVATGQART